MRGIALAVLTVSIGFISFAHAQQPPEVESLRLAKDIAYADGEPSGRALDIYGKAGGNGRPVMIYVHGGAWMIGNKSRVWHKPKAFADAGWLFVSAGYRLEENRADPDLQAGDIAEAVQWVAREIGAYGGDPERIVLMGHSAGAHLVALAPLAPEYKLPQGMVDGVLLLDGAGYDINYHMDTVKRPRAQEIYQTVFGQDRAFRAKVSPTLRAGETGTPPPFLINYVAHRDDAKVQAERLAAALREAGGQAEIFAAEGHTHRSINVQFGTPGEAVTEHSFTWLGALFDDQ